MEAQVERALRRGAADDIGRALELLGMLRGEIERINGLLHEYLQVLRRPGRYVPRRFSLPQALRDALRFVEPKARDCQVQLELTLPGFSRGIAPESLAGRVGMRPLSPDRLPIVGPVPAASAGGNNSRQSASAAASVFAFARIIPR